MGLLARTRQGDQRVLDGAGTLMACCLATGLPLASACSGRGACGRCVVTVLQGGEWLTSAADHEVEVLGRMGAEPHQRLSCQCTMPPMPGDLLITTGYW